MKHEKCERCSKQAKIVLPYGPHKFCKEHFEYFFEKRIRKTIRTNQLIKYGEKICVGVSGGKDSMVTLHLLNKVFEKQNKIEAIMIDEGIQGYRDRAIKVAENYCKKNDIDYHIVKFEDELNCDMEKVMKQIKKNEKLGSTCAFCGVFRRNFLNKKALEIKADKIATGHNLDDECQSIAMSFFNNDLGTVLRSGPSTGKKKTGLVPRIKPLYETPEKEIIAYAAFQNLEHYSEECCPFSWMAKRNSYRKMLNELEEETPGTKYSILAAFKELKPLLVKNENKKENKIKECKNCGSISNADLCGVCKQLEKLEKSKGKTNKKNTAKKNPAGKKRKLSCAVTKGTKKQ